VFLDLFGSLPVMTATATRRIRIRPMLHYANKDAARGIPTDATAAAQPRSTNNRAPKLQAKKAPDGRSISAYTLLVMSSGFCAIAVHRRAPTPGRRWNGCTVFNASDSRDVDDLSRRCAADELVIRTDHAEGVGNRVLRDAPRWCRGQVNDLEDV
jgi:hypothetical protein